MNATKNSESLTETDGLSKAYLKGKYREKMKLSFLFKVMLY